MRTKRKKPNLDAKELTKQLTEYIWLEEKPGIQIRLIFVVYVIKIFEYLKIFVHHWGKIMTAKEKSYVPLHTIFIAWHIN